MCCSAPNIYIFPIWLLLTLIPVTHYCVLFFMVHNVRMSERQTDPEPLCVTGSPLQWVYGPLTYGTSVGSSADHLTTACGNSLSFLFLSSIINTFPVVRESKVCSNMWRNTKVRNSHTPLAVPSWWFSPLKLVKLYSAFSFFFLFHVNFPLLFRSKFSLSLDT